MAGNRKAIAIDPRFISKSGKHTPWISHFLSGRADITQRGLEILGIGLIDIDTKDCISLQAVQSPYNNTLENITSNLIDWYLFSLKSIQEELLGVSKYTITYIYF